MDDDGKLNVAQPKISGKIKLTYNEATEAERALEVDADAYMAELRGQVCTCDTSVRVGAVILACSNDVVTCLFALASLQSALERARNTRADTSDNFNTYVPKCALIRALFRPQGLSCSLIYVVAAQVISVLYIMT